ncbi:tetracycline-efflux transporter [Heterostelium album PN500]|uniref:Tetracycline-efflux transporter n=1 Tax=Heterostelium pallidum (strain ATCC 26659 / Pp 5 / PN500) TaxID=670386 RepID=D3BPL4_HETP5|nr:tetracycline-efflux transporter [Heterostelium album PN500]EFA76634.1 tetracycline-efflux transporter [Heterostelium album PN500]|eukprot:XP_020428766.1 tetracycline-efflux transporter [Heterostelium album PN500]
MDIKDQDNQDTAIFLSTILTNSQKLPETEVQSLIWIAQQYSLPWNITKTDCKSINNNIVFESITCITDLDDIEHVTIVVIANEIPYDNGFPDPLLEINLPYLVEFSSSPRYPVKNLSISILDKLDNPNQIALNSICLNSENFTIPSNFPQNLPKLVLFENGPLSTLSSDIPSSLLNIYKVSLYGQIDPSMKIIINPNEQYKIRFLTVFYIPNLNLIIGDNFPILEGLNLNAASSASLILSSKTLNLLVLQNVDCTVTDAPNIKSLFFFDGSFSPMNLTMLPSLKRVYIIESPTYNSWPQAKWFADKNITLMTGTIPDEYSAIKFFSLSINNMELVNGSVSEKFCATSKLSLTGTNITSVPDCIYCCWDLLSNGMPSTIQIDPNFTCPYQINSITYVMTPSSQGKITISGKNLGYGFNEDTSPNLKVIVPNSLFELSNLPSFGSQNVMFSSIFQLYYQLDWVTDVTNIQSISGQQTEFALYVSIKGTFNSTWIYSTNVNNQLCVVTSLVADTLNCTITKPIIDFTSELLSVNMSSPYLSFNGNGTFVMMYPVVTSTSTVTTQGGDVQIYGFFGRKNSKPVVTIGQQSCKVSFWGIYNITCGVSSLPKGQTNLTVTIDNFVHYSNMVIVPLNLTYCIDPTDSNPVICNNHGSCVNGYCSCAGGFSGFYCDSKTSGGTINPNSTTPSASFIADDHQFDFNMVSIQELGPDASVAFELLTNSWNYRKEENQTLTSLYYYLNNTRPDLFVIVTIQYSPDPRTVEFAGVTSNLPPNSLKVTVQIDGWEYLSTLNTLRVVFSTEQSNVPSDCAESKETIGVNQLDNSVQYLKIIKNGVAFYGNFLPVVLSNGRPAYSKNEIVNQTDDQMWIGVSLPQCAYCLIDPSFNVLINVDGGCKTKGLKAWEIATIVTVVGIFTIAAAVGAIIYIKKRRIINYESQKLKSKLSRIGS